MTTATRPELQNLGSLITYEDETGATCYLGYLMDFTGHGVYDATYGRVEISREDADTHNRLLDEAMLKGLDENCAIGQGAMFYYQGKGNVTTFMGTVVADRVNVLNGNVTFIRHGKKYRGRMRKNADCVWFKRVK